MKTKGQVWVMDYVAGFLIFVLLLILSVNIMTSIKSNTEYSEAYEEAVYISSNILSPGNPYYWDASTVLLPGIAENNRINISKLEEFDQLDYGLTKTMFNVKGDYLFYFSNSSGIINISKCTRGYFVETDASCTPNLSSVKYSNLAKIERIGIYNSTLAKITIYVWN